MAGSAMALPLVLVSPVFTAIYGTNFKPKIFTDITTPDTKFYNPYIGKISHVF
jgi:hypothetical protein